MSQAQAQSQIPPYDKVTDREMSKPEAGGTDNFKSAEDAEREITKELSSRTQQMAPHAGPLVEDMETRIRTKAHELWILEGKREEAPDVRHWEMAGSLIASEDRPIPQVPDRFDDRL